jgi:hypothetical protein
LLWSWICIIILPSLHRLYQCPSHHRKYVVGRNFCRPPGKLSPFSTPFLEFRTCISSYRFRNPPLSVYKNWRSLVIYSHSSALSSPVTLPNSNHTSSKSSCKSSSVLLCAILGIKVLASSALSQQSEPMTQSPVSAIHSQQTLHSSPTKLGTLKTRQIGLLNQNSLNSLSGLLLLESRENLEVGLSLADNPIIVSLLFPVANL